MKREIRALQASGTEVDTSGDCFRFQGYAAVYNEPSEDMGFREFIAPDGFVSILATNPDVRMLGMNHDANHVMARTLPDTLRLSSDSRGLAYEAKARKTPYSEEIAAGVADGNIDSMSYGFGGAVSDWDESDPSCIVRTIRSFGALYDISPVAWPAFTQTSIGLRTGHLTDMELRSLIDADRPRNFTRESQIRERRRRLLTLGS